LSDARQKTIDHGYMYASDEGIPTVDKPSKARRELLAYIGILSDPLEQIDLEKFELLLDRASKLTSR